MTESVDKLAEEFLHIASHLRLAILLDLHKTKTNLSTLSKKLDTTSSEIHRNLTRLTDANLIQRDSTGNYSLTTYGNMVCANIQSWEFFLLNSKYFSKHTFGNLENNFIQSIGSLHDSKHVQGFINTQDIWKKIYKNSKQYIYNILFEVSYDSETIEIIKSQIKKGIIINSVFSKKAIISEKRKTAVDDLDIKTAIKNQQLSRKISDDVQVLVVLNENEGCVMFPKSDGDVDVSEAFYGTTKSFHDWCLAYFQSCWTKSGSFYEEKIKK